LAGGAAGIVVAQRVLVAVAAVRKFDMQCRDK
jgi:hypothetical protein